jgi:nucleoside-diphosphate-sugar epimerase
MAEEKPSVLILGGTGFIGRNLVKHLVDNDLTSFIRVADKGLPATSGMHPSHKAFFDNKEKVQFKQCDLARADHAVRAFADHKFNYVINLCGETRPGMTDADYKLKNIDTADRVSEEALKHLADIKKWVEVSHGAVYKNDNKASTEDSKLVPWNNQGRTRHVAEAKVLEKEGLPVVILRPAMVYGPGDVYSMAPRYATAACYKHDGKKMEMLWDGNLRLNTVHVRDVCTAIWVAATTAAAGSVYNLADSGNTTQGSVNAILGNLFEIKTGYLGFMINQAAKLALSSVANQANGKHTPLWSAACKASNPPVGNSSIVSPYLDLEQLMNSHMCLNGSKITTELEFTYAHPQMTAELVREAIQFHIEQGVFPNVFA